MFSREMAALQRLNGLEKLVCIAIDQSLNHSAAEWAKGEVTLIFEEVRASLQRVISGVVAEHVKADGPTVVHVHVPRGRAKARAR
jgi:hypothetical protein